MEDCIKKEKKAIFGMLLLFSILLVVLLKDYINIVLALVYLLAVFIMFIIWTIPYVRCLMENAQKFKKFK